MRHLGGRDNSIWEICTCSEQVGRECVDNLHSAEAVAALVCIYGPDKARPSVP